MSTFALIGSAYAAQARVGVIVLAPTVVRECAHNDPTDASWRGRWRHWCGVELATFEHQRRERTVSPPIPDGLVATTCENCAETPKWAKVNACPDCNESGWVGGRLLLGQEECRDDSEEGWAAPCAHGGFAFSSDHERRTALRWECRVTDIDLITVEVNDEVLADGAAVLMVTGLRELDEPITTMRCTADTITAVEL